MQRENVITGFQGIEPERNRISTLGRGGSDTSAVALAVAVKADLCDIYTDVDGVYTTDPRIVPRARRLPKFSYEEMLEMASLGSKVLQTQICERASSAARRSFLETLVRLQLAEPRCESAPELDLGHATVVGRRYEWQGF